MTHGELQHISLHSNFRNSIAYVLDEVRAIERMSLLGLGSFLPAMFQYLPCLELLDTTPVHFIPTSLVPFRTYFERFPCCELCRFFTMF